MVGFVLPDVENAERSVLLPLAWSHHCPHRHVWPGDLVVPLQDRPGAAWSRSSANTIPRARSTMSQPVPARSGRAPRVRARGTRSPRDPRRSRNDRSTLLALPGEMSMRIVPSGWFICRTSRVPTRSRETTTWPTVRQGRSSLGVARLGSCGGARAPASSTKLVGGGDGRFTTNYLGLRLRSPIIASASADDPGPRRGPRARGGRRSPCCRRRPPRKRSSRRRSSSTGPSRPGSDHFGKRWPTLQRSTTSLTPASATSWISNGSRPLRASR